MFGPRAKRLAGSCWHVDLERVRWESSETLTPGKHTLEFEVHYDGLGFGTSTLTALSGGLTNRDHRWGHVRPVASRQD